MNLKKILLPILVFKIFTFQNLFTQESFAYEPFIEDLIKLSENHPRDHLGRGATTIFLEAIKNGCIKSTTIFITRIKQLNILTKRRRNIFFEGIKKNPLIWNVLNYYSNNDSFANNVLIQFEETYPEIENKTNSFELLCTALQEDQCDILIETIYEFSKKKHDKSYSSYRFAIARAKEILEKYPDL